MTKTLVVDLTSLGAAPSATRGLGRYLRELARGLGGLPQSVLGDLRLLALTQLDWDGSYQVVEDFTSFDAPPPKGLQFGPRDYYRWAYTRRLSLWSALRTIGADALHLGDPHATPLFLGFTECLKIVTCHDLIPLRYPERYLGWKDGGPYVGRAIERRRYMSADLVIAISDATKDDLRSILGISTERIVRVYNAIDLERWSEPSLPSDVEVTQRLDLQRRPFVIYVGGCDWHKNIEGMMRALAAARQLGSDIELAWAGRLGTEQREAATKMARDAGVEHAVRFLGFIGDDELRALYRQALAHLLVSHAEGFGLTVVEAMAAGCPVVTTVGGSLGEIVGDAALKVPAEDAQAAGAALVRLSHDDALCGQLRVLGRERAQLFSRDVQARGMVAAFRSLLQV